MKPKRYKKKPVEIEAMKWEGSAESASEIISWVLANGGAASYTCTANPCSERAEDHVISISTLEGIMKASHGDYIIKGIQDEFYPCKPDIFENSYEEVKGN